MGNVVDFPNKKGLPPGGKAKGAVTPDTLTVFGARLQSRYGLCQELAEMLLFMNEAAGLSLARPVKELFYDSKSGICVVTLATEVRLGSLIEQKLLSIGKRTLSCFEWVDGRIYTKDSAPPPALA